MVVTLLASRSQEETWPIQATLAEYFRYYEHKYNSNSMVARLLDYKQVLAKIEDERQAKMQAILPFISPLANSKISSFPKKFGEPVLSF